MSMSTYVVGMTETGKKVILNKEHGVVDWDDGDTDVGVEVILKKLPKNIKKLRFVNSY